jgi:transposase
LPFFFFFLGLVAQLIRLGVVTGQELIVDTSLLPAWYKADPDATWQKYAKKAAVFGYKVHTVLCRQADLPVFIMVTPASMHDSQIGWFVILIAAVIFGFRVLVVYADSAYFDWRMFKVVHDFLHAHAAINYNLRRAGKRKFATPFFLRQWKRLVIYPRADIERHFAWIKRYFGLKYYQYFTLLRVCSFVTVVVKVFLPLAHVA